MDATSDLELKLAENDVIKGVKNFLLAKGKTSRSDVRCSANAEKKEHGIDLKIYKGTANGRGNIYHIEAKGDILASGDKKKTNFLTEFRWAVSQIILRINHPSNKNNRIYGIAIPAYEKDRCIKLIKNNWALKELGIRLYCAYKKDGKLTADEYTPKDLYRLR